jgi:hypothetical protein
VEGPGAFSPAILSINCLNSEVMICQPQVLF